LYISDALLPRGRSKRFPQYLPGQAGFGVCVTKLLKFKMEHMPKRLHNWTYRNVIDFLKEHGFSFCKPLKGSDERRIMPGDNGKPDRLVEVNFTHSPYPQNAQDHDLAIWNRSERVD
jgi:hypothetical protein